MSSRALRERTVSRRFVQQPYIHIYIHMYVRYFTCCLYCCCTAFSTYIYIYTHASDMILLLYLVLCCALKTQASVKIAGGRGGGILCHMRRAAIYIYYPELCTLREVMRNKEYWGTSKFVHTCRQRLVYNCCCCAGAGDAYLLCMVDVQRYLNTGFLQLLSDV